MTMRKGMTKFSLTNSEEGMEPEYKEPYNRLVKIKRNCKNGIKGIKETLCLKSDKSPKDSIYTRAYLTLEEKVSEIQHEDSPVKDILLQIASIHRSFAIEQANFESRVADTLDNGHISNFINKEFPRLEAEKNVYKKMSKEKDSCENKACKEKEKRRPSDLSSSYHEDKLEDDVERSKKDAELAEDKFSSSLYSQISREAKLAENFVQYAENLKECLRNMNAKLDEILPQMNEIIKNTRRKPIFGEPLEYHLKTTKARIAKPLHFAVKSLEDSLDEEGLFRISPGLLQLKKAKSMLDAGLPFSKVSGILEDPHVAAGVIKCYLRELPDPLFMSEFLSEWVSIEQLEDDNHRLREIKSIIRNMPDENQENIAFLFQYLQKLTLNCDANKMTQDNVNIVFTPNLLWSKEDDRVRGLTRTVKTMLTHVQEIFPEEIICDEEVCSIHSKMEESIIVARLETFLEREEDICRVVEPTDVDSEKYHSAIQFRTKHKRNQSGSGLLGLMTNMNLRKSSSMGHFDNRASRPEKWRNQHQDTL